MNEDEIEYEKIKGTIHVNSLVKQESNFSLTLDKFRFHVCPIGVITQESDRLIKLFFLCREFKSLPEQGAIFDQDNYTMQVFEIIASEINRIENEKIDKENKKLKSNGNQIK